MSTGDSSAAHQLLPLVYDDLRAMAGRYFQGQPSDMTLQPTALVHEAYLKLINVPEGNWNGRVHFCAVAATAMRQILQDRARRKRAAKRSGERRQAPLELLESTSGEPAMDIVALDDALAKLEILDARQVRIVELRFFSGLTVMEVAQVLDVSTRTVEKNWRHARVWLRRELESGTSA